MVNKSPTKQRQGPLEHAKDFKVGHQMKGQDGQLWEIKLITKQDGRLINDGLK
jgi:hypothetical protein